MVNYSGSRVSQMPLPNAKEATGGGAAITCWPTKGLRASTAAINRILPPSRGRRGFECATFKLKMLYAGPARRRAGPSSRPCSGAHCRRPARAWAVLGRRAARRRNAAGPADGELTSGSFVRRTVSQRHGFQMQEVAARPRSAFQRRPGLPWAIQPD